MYLGVENQFVCFLRIRSLNENWFDVGKGANLCKELKVDIIRRISKCKYNLNRFGKDLGPTSNSFEKMVSL